MNRVEQDLEEQEWYWGAISKHDVDAKFHGTLDGTFLVYDSHTRGRYILMVRRGKANEVIHISHCNGMYGFLDTSKLPPKPIFTEFRTIPALVEHFRRVPLTKYNERLDITLDHPIRRSAVVSVTSYAVGYLPDLLYAVSEPVQRTSILVLVIIYSLVAIECLVKSKRLLLNFHKELYSSPDCCQ